MFTVQLQDPMTLRTLWLGVAAALLLLAAVLFFVYTRIPAGSFSSLFGKNNSTSAGGFMDLKSKYLTLLSVLMIRLQKGEVSPRKAFQTSSFLLRCFVYEATGKPVHFRTLTEMRKMNVKVASELVGTLYESSFAPRSLGNAEAAINRTSEVIRRW